MENGNSAPSNKLSKLALTLLVIAFFWLIISNMRLSAQLNDIQSSIANIGFNQMHEMSFIRSEIWHGMDQLRHELEQATRIASDVVVSVRSFNGGDLTADVEVSFFLREFNAGDIVNVYAREGNGQHFLSKVADRSETGRFIANMTLPLFGNYSLSFVAEGPTIRTGALADVFLADELCERFVYGLDTSFTTSRVGGQSEWTIRITPLLNNDTQGNRSLAIRDVLFFIESSEGAVIRSHDLRNFIYDEYSSFQVLSQESMWEAGDWELFEIPIVEVDGTAWADNRQARDYVTPGEIIVARIVIYDYLGIRYEQSSRIYVPESPNQTVVGHGMAVALPGSIDRVVEYGEHSWDFIRIVRR